MKIICSVMNSLDNKFLSIPAIYNGCLVDLVLLWKTKCMSRLVSVKTVR